MANRATSKHFHFYSAKRKTINNIKLILFETDNIEYINSSLEDNLGKSTFLENYAGKVFMKENLLDDNGFCEYNELMLLYKRKTTRGKLLQNGSYSTYFKNANLFLDIDKKGKVWLTDESFYEITIRQRLVDLQIQLREVQNNIQLVKQEIEDLETAQGYDEMYQDSLINEENAWTNYCDSIQEEISNAEIRSMDEETNGFWNVD